jgi:transcriptional regulator with XRE-family HTH domain
MATAHMNGTTTRKKIAASGRLTPRSVGKPDVEMGRRLRIRRVEKNMSQAELGHELGISFQQVQKYEKGVNRIGAVRMEKIAKVLDVPINFFFGDGKPKEETEAQSLMIIDPKYTLRLLRAYAKIGDLDTQRNLVRLMESMAGIGD